jgi:DNA-binding transcriptional ArsR family regulator
MNQFVPSESSEQRESSEPSESSQPSEPSEPNKFVEIFEMPDDTLIYKTTEIHSALADSTRFKILCSLAQSDKHVGALVDLMGMSQPAVSHHLRLLRDRGLVTAHRDGQYVIYRFADDHVRSLIMLSLEHAAEEDI